MRKSRPDRAAQYENVSYLGAQDRIAASCRRFRQTVGWTQEDAAHETGLSTRLYQRVEAADANLTLTTLARLADGFGVDVSELFAKPRKKSKRV